MLCFQKKKKEKKVSEVRIYLKSETSVLKCMVIITRRDTAVLLHALSVVITQMWLVQIFFFRDFQTKECVPTALDKEEWL